MRRRKIIRRSTKRGIHLNFEKVKDILLGKKDFKEVFLKIIRMHQDAVDPIVCIHGLPQGFLLRDEAEDWNSALSSMEYGLSLSFVKNTH
jgi:hypothetical protein